MKTPLRTLLFTASFLMSATSVRAQIYDHLFQDQYRIDTTETRALGLRIDATGFFRNNEYESPLVSGYTLPGVQISPRLTYNPLSNIHIEAGLHAIFFNGANKYPSWAYSDIATWKGDQYQHGCHLLPWVRLQADFTRLSIVVGNIYGGQNHGLNDVLWNPETNLSQDPEMGFQLLWDLPHLHMDTWLNWQSFIYKLDTHQEAFTFGTNWKIYANDRNAQTQWYLPVQLMAQHRGGEVNIGGKCVQTLWNASLGAGVRVNSNRQVLSWMDYQVNAIAAWQQAGDLWGFKTGFALHAAAEFCLLRSLNFRAGYVHVPHHFVSLYGNPLFGTQSLSYDQPAISYDGNSTVYARVSYDYCFARNYTLGADINIYASRLGTENLSSTSFNFGLYFRVNPTIIFKRWK